MAKVKKHIPNMVTCCNLLSGCVATVMAFNGEFGWAMSFIILGAIFDFFDGMTARLLGVSSPMGVEIDSLADDITFGLAPAAIVYNFMLNLNYPNYLDCIAEYIPYLAFIIAAFSALRLAKFNIDDRQTTSFIGLPTPANALFWSSLIAGGGAWIKDELTAGWLLILILVAITSYMLVCEVPMFSLKFKNLKWEYNKERYIFLIISIPMFFLGVLAPVAIITWYILFSIILCLKGNTSK